MPLAIPASGVGGFLQSAHLYDGVAINTHFIYIDTPYGSYNTVIAKLAELGVRHIREGIIASWFDARSGSSDVALRALHARNLGLPDGEQPIFVLGGTTDFPPQQPHPYTTNDWFATMDGGHQHYNNDANSGIPGAIPGVGGPLSDAQKPFATPEVTWALFSGIQSSNEPQGDVSQIPAWQGALTAGKNLRVAAVYEGLPYVTETGIQTDAVVADLPTVGSVAMTNSTWDTWGDLSQGTGNVDVGDFHIYMGGSNPSFEHMQNEMFNDRSYNGRLKLPHETHYPAAALPYFMTETGYINSGNDSAHFPIPNDVIARYLIQTLLINAKLGFRRTFIYELVDEADLPTVSERNFGLYYHDWTPKEQAFAIRNYLRITEFGEAPANLQTPISYSITGFTPGPSNFQTRLSDGSHYDTSADRLDHLLVQQDSYRYLIWVWRQVNLYNREQGTYTTPNTQTLTLDLGDLDVSGVSIATPTAGGTVTPQDGLTFTSLTVLDGQTTFTISDAPRAIAITVRPPAQDGEAMSSFTLNRSDVFPVGTSVGLYTQLNPATQTPLGPLNQSQTVASDGTITFTSLASGITYYAYALVNSQPTHISFQATDASGTGGGGIDTETDPLSVKLVPTGAQSIVPNVDVPALTAKSYSGSAQGASVIEIRDASASDALRLQVTKEGSFKVRQANAFFPHVMAYGAPTDTQPQFQVNGPDVRLGLGGATTPDTQLLRVTDGNGNPRLRLNNAVDSASGARLEILSGGLNVTAATGTAQLTNSATEVPILAQHTLTNSHSDPAGSYGTVRGVTTYLKTDPAAPTSLISRGFDSVTNVGTVGGIQASGTLHNYTSTMVISNSTNGSEHCGYVHFQRYVDAVTGRAWITDFNLQGPIAAQPNLLSGLNVFIGNYYNGSPSSSPSYAYAAMTWPNSGGGISGNQLTANSYPLDVGFWVIGKSTGGATGYKTAFRAGQGSGTTNAGGWNLPSSQIDTGLLVDDFAVNGVYVRSRATGTGSGIKLASNLDLELVESSSAPSAVVNSARIYAVDNGSGKTQLMVRFGTGASQQIAIEP